METKEKARIRANLWHKEHKIRHLKSMREYQRKNFEVLKVKKAEYYKKNKSKIVLKLVEWREKNREKIALQKREWYIRNKSRAFENVKRYAKATPLKVKARGILYRAVKSGKIIKGCCQVCASENVQAHHPDYKFPLKVEWLCIKHHYQKHRKYGKV